MSEYRRGRGIRLRLLVSAFLLLFVPVVLAGAQAEEINFEGIRRAIRENDFDRAIELCRQELRRNSENYDLNFLLGQAYAFSGRWDEALAVLSSLAGRFPGNPDVILMQARVESWKKNYRAAEEGYRSILEIAPGNLEALTGLAEIVSWQGDYGQAVALYERIVALKKDRKEDGQADILFRLGRVHVWSGNYERAREAFGQALRLEPENKAYRRALKTATPRWQDKYEFRYEHQVESFSDDRPGYLDDRLVFQIRTRPGPLVFKADMTRRFRENDQQFEIEFYPRLWDRAYAYLNASYSPKALHFPEYSFQFELYQAFFTSWDISAGYRKMNFATKAVSVYLGSLGCYFGKQNAFFRWYYTPRSEGDDFSWTVNLRRYFSDSSFVYAGYGQGSKPYDIVTLEDYGVAASRVFLAGFDWVLFKRLRLQLNYTHRDEGELNRNLFFFSAGFGW